MVVLCAMKADLTKIQDYISQAILHKLIEYQQAHHLDSIPQSIATALAEFFNLSSSQPYLEPAGEELIQRIEHLETTVVHLLQRLEYVESSASLSTSVINHTVERGFADPFAVPTVKYSDEYSLAEDRKTSSNSPDPKELCGHIHGQIMDDLDHVNVVVDSDLLDELPQDTQISVLDLSRGISSSMLAKRLETNLATLRKYLRDQKRIDWAALRDPDGLGWTYDALLHRYYPVPINTDSKASFSESIVPSQTHSSGCPQKLLAEETANRDVQDGNGMPVSYETGLSQSQLSKLTGIPTNTLQRWKQLPDCADRIQKRTQGKFSYWYSRQYELFCPQHYV